MKIFCAKGENNDIETNIEEDSGNENSEKIAVKNSEDTGYRTRRILKIESEVSNNDRPREISRSNEEGLYANSEKGLDELQGESRTTNKGIARI